MITIESFRMNCQRRILGIRWHDFVRNSEVSLRTGLAPASDRITRGRNAIFGHVARLPDNTAVPHTRPCYAKSSYRSVDPQTLHGNVHQVDHVWTDQLRRDNNNAPIATLWRQESDATVRADYALTTTTTTCLGGSLSTKAARPRCSHYSASRMQLPDWCSA